MDKTERKTRVISNWQPSKLDFCTILEEFQEKSKILLPEYSFRGWEIRDPKIMKEHQKRRNLQFSENPFVYHQDDLWDFEAVMWSNILPTSIKFEDDGTLLRTKHGDIILINNLEVKHRAPRIGENTNRWFARVKLFYGKTVG